MGIHVLGLWSWCCCSHFWVVKVLSRCEGLRWYENPWCEGEVMRLWYNKILCIFNCGNTNYAMHSHKMHKMDSFHHDTFWQTKTSNRNPSFSIRHHTHTYIYIYTYVYNNHQQSQSLHLSLSLYIYIHICMHHELQPTTGKLQISESPHYPVFEKLRCNSSSAMQIIWQSGDPGAVSPCFPKGCEFCESKLPKNHGNALKICWVQPFLGARSRSWGFKIGDFFFWSWNFFPAFAQYTWLQ